MNKKILPIVSIAFTVALFALIAVQLYWIKIDFKVREEHFESKVYEALNNISSKLERMDTTAGYIKTKVSRQAVRRPGGDIFRMVTNLSIDSNGIQFSRITSSDLPGDSLRNLKLDPSAQNFLKQISTQKKPLQTTSGDLSNRTFPTGSDFFKEEYSFDSYNNYRQKVDTNLVDSVLRAE